MSVTPKPRRKSAWVEFDCASYKPFMSTADGKALLGSADKSSPLGSAIWNLAFTWRSVSHARALPWVTVSTAVQTARKTAGSEGFEFGVELMIGAIQAELSRQSLARLKPGARRDLKLVLPRLRERVRKEARRESELPIPEQELEDYWRYMLHGEAFGIAVVASERQAFCELYFSYENFLGRLVEIKEGKWPRSTKRVLEGIKGTFNPDLFARAWEDPLIRDARLARDAFVHRGGVADARLANTTFLQIEDDGFISVGPSHTNALYEVLRDRTLELIEALKALDPASAVGQADTSR